MDRLGLDPIPLLRSALDAGDTATAAGLIDAFSRSRSLSLRAMRELAGLGEAADGAGLAGRTFAALVMLLGLDADD